MISDKAQLRKEFLAKRVALAPSIITESSKKIVERIISSKEFQSAKTISSYYPCRNEVDLLSLLSVARASRPCNECAHRHHGQDAHDTNKTIVFPRVVKGTEKLDFYLIKKLDEFEKGVFGLMEPQLSLQKVEIEKIDLFLVPGVAFTKSGERLGYGGGYYDETLRHKKHGSKTIGVSFEIQITDSLPNDPWDLKLDSIITEIAFYS